MIVGHGLVRLLFRGHRHSLVILQWASILLLASLRMEKMYDLDLWGYWSAQMLDTVFAETTGAYR